MNILGILNCSADSFSGDGIGDPTAALEKAQAMMKAGAWMIDVGASSTKPGTAPRTAAEEVRIIEPMLAILAANRIPFSVDTVHAATMRLALDCGAAMINDQRALREPGAIEALAASQALVCLMHTESSDPATLHASMPDGEPLLPILKFFKERIAACEHAGIARERLILDPGFGFGKTYRQQAAVLRDLDRLHVFNCRILVGLSRKRWIAALGGDLPMEERLAPSLVVGMLALEYGADILRLHDVAAAARAIQCWGQSRDCPQTGDK